MLSWKAADILLVPSSTKLGTNTVNQHSSQLKNKKKKILNCINISLGLCISSCDWGGDQGCLILRWNILKLQIFILNIAAKDFEEWLCLRPNPTACLFKNLQCIPLYFIFIVHSTILATDVWIQNKFSNAINACGLAFDSFYVLHKYDKLNVHFMLVFRKEAFDRLRCKFTLMFRKERSTAQGGFLGTDDLCWMQGMSSRA